MTRISTIKTKNKKGLEFKDWNLFGICDLESGISKIIMPEEKKQNLINRAPVVVILGHVDSGKTSILDAIRKTHVAEKETGGITQHVGAYEVEFQGKKITFIDTPGHEAFSAMRSRGAKVADLAVLVVDCCEGVMPQTKEAISHIKKAGISLIVALNKIDRSDADPEKIKRELTKNDVLVESMGGKVPSVETSAKTGKGIDSILELILLVAEMEGLKGDISKSAEGVVIEAYLDRFRGPTATLILRDGELKMGDIIATPSTLGKIKSLEDFRGNPIKTALPSQPVIVLGLEDVPQVGNKFKVYSGIEEAKKYVAKKERKKEKREVIHIPPDKKVLNLILKADVLGSLEAIEEVLKGLPQEKVILRILKKEVGEINENDVRLVLDSRARILGFRVKIDSIAASLAERQNLKIKTFDIIYELFQEVRQMMEKIMTPEIVRVDLGKIKALVIFWTEKNRQIVGGKVIEGEIKKGFSIEVFRRDEKIGRGKLISLQRDKKEIEKGIKGDEVGILYEGDTKIQEGDILVIFKEERRKGEL